jgi:hypothetical protein
MTGSYLIGLLALVMDSAMQKAVMPFVLHF